MDFACPLSSCWADSSHGRRLAPEFQSQARQLSYPRRCPRNGVLLSPSWWASLKEYVVRECILGNRFQTNGSQVKAGQCCPVDCCLVGLGVFKASYELVMMVYQTTAIPVYGGGMAVWDYEGKMQQLRVSDFCCGSQAWQAGRWAVERWGGWSRRDAPISLPSRVNRGL